MSDMTPQEACDAYVEGLWLARFGKPVMRQVHPYKTPFCPYQDNQWIQSCWCERG